MAGDDDGVVVADDDGDGVACSVGIGPAAGGAAVLHAYSDGTSGAQSPCFVVSTAASGRKHRARDKCQ